MNTVLYDEFTAVDGTLLEDHTPIVGGPYTKTAGQCRIVGNKLVAAASGTYTVPVNGITRFQLDFIGQGVVAGTGDGFTASFEKVLGTAQMKLQMALAGTNSGTVVPKGDTYSLLSIMANGSGTALRHWRWSYDGNFMAWWRDNTLLQRFAFERSALLPTVFKLVFSSVTADLNFKGSSLRLSTW